MTKTKETCSELINGQRWPACKIVLLNLIPVFCATVLFIASRRRAAARGMQSTMLLLCCLQACHDALLILVIAADSGE
jgi:hypothetical protein